MCLFAKPDGASLPDDPLGAGKKAINWQKGRIVHYTILCAILLCSGYLIFKNLGDAAYGPMRRKPLS